MVGEGGGPPGSGLSKGLRISAKRVSRVACTATTVTWRGFTFSQGSSSPLPRQALLL